MSLLGEMQETKARSFSILLRMHWIRRRYSFTESRFS